MIIAIDGPAGSGKSTVAKILAERLGFLYIDTGAMYRAVTIKVLKNNIKIQDENGIIKSAQNSRIELKSAPTGLKVFLDGIDVSEEIRRPYVTKIVSDISRIPGVRNVLLGLQRDLGSRNNAVLEGRDIGTVVFPKAEKKFFLDADFKVRVNRRFKELEEKDKSIILDNVNSDLKNRDNIDSNRKVAPLKKADDAIYVDTTNMTIDEVVEVLLRETKK